MLVDRVTNLIKQVGRFLIFPFGGGIAARHRLEIDPEIRLLAPPLVREPRILLMLTACLIVFLGIAALLLAFLLLFPQALGGW